MRKGKGNHLLAMWTFKLGSQQITALQVSHRILPFHNTLIRYIQCALVQMVLNATQISVCNGELCKLCAAGFNIFDTRVCLLATFNVRCWYFKHAHIFEDMRFAIWYSLHVLFYVLRAYCCPCRTLSLYCADTLTGWKRQERNPAMLTTWAQSLAWF